MYSPKLFDQKFANFRHGDGSLKTDDQEVLEHEWVCFQIILSNLVRESHVNHWPHLFNTVKTTVFYKKTRFRKSVTKPILDATHILLYVIYSYLSLYNPVDIFFTPCTFFHKKLKTIHESHLLFLMINALISLLHFALEMIHDHFRDLGPIINV